MRDAFRGITIAAMVLVNHPVFYVLLWLGLIWLLYRRRMFIKV